MMNARKDYYMVLDTETATLPFANRISEGDEKVKQNIAIAKPLVYDFGWVIIDRQGNIVEKVEYLVQETFFVPNVFNTAYYKEKRPLYMDMLDKGEIEPKNWKAILTECVEKAKMCKAVCAYNAAFDFKKAIAFTDRYINALYSSDYNEWERKQYGACMSIKRGKKDFHNADYLTPYWKIMGEEFPIVDLWEVACDKLLNTDRYRKFCLDNEYWTASATYFKTSAEIAYRYLMKENDFIEAHTALDDAIIESQILAKALRKGKVNPCIGSFPFRILGGTVEYACEKKHSAMESLYDCLYEQFCKASSPSYASKLENLVDMLQSAM